MEDQLRLPIMEETNGFKKRVWKTSFNDVYLEIDDPTAKPVYHNAEWTASLERHSHVTRKRRGINRTRVITQYTATLTHKMNYRGEDLEGLVGEAAFTTDLTTTDAKAKHKAVHAYAGFVAYVLGQQNAAVKRLEVVKANKPKDLIVCSQCNGGIFAKEVPDYCYNCGARFWEGYVRASKKLEEEEMLRKANEAKE